MSESSEMYLLTIAIMVENGRPSPIPLPLLAEEMDVLPVSVNQMVRKLEEDDLVVYDPYKGVTLTENGRDQARRIMRHRRLWEVFLVRHLQISPDEAEELACGVEHITTPLIAQRLAGFLEGPSHCPHGRPIPPGGGTSPALHLFPLTHLEAGQGATIATLEGPEQVKDFLRTQGVTPGAQFAVQAAGEEAWLVQTDAGWVSLSTDLVNHIMVKTESARHMEKG